MTTLRDIDEGAQVMTPTDEKQLAIDLIRIYEMAEAKTPTFAAQGQAMDGYTELASYRHAIQRYLRLKNNDQPT